MDRSALLDPTAWQVVNDDVMGGASSAHAARVGDALRLSGTLRLEFNGGFASMRRRLPAPLPAAATGLEVTVRGDGNRYRLTVYTGAASRGLGAAPHYYAEFAAPAGVVHTSALPWAQFVATWRGRPVPQAPPLAAAAAIGVGVMLTRAGHAAGSGAFALDLLDLAPLLPPNR